MCNFVALSDRYFVCFFPSDCLFHLFENNIFELFSSGWKNRASGSQTDNRASGSQTDNRASGGQTENGTSGSQTEKFKQNVWQTMLESYTPLFFA